MLEDESAPEQDADEIDQLYLVDRPQDSITTAVMSLFE
jgi:hypothetical protein